MRRQWWGLVLGIVAVGAMSGCRTLGLESKGARDARRLQAENQQKESMIASISADKDNLVAESAKEREARIRAEGEIKLLNERLLAMSKTNAGGGIAVNGNSVALQGDILFQPGKVSIRSQAKPLLQKVANIVKSSPANAVVYVDGHTDSDPLVKTKNLYKDNYNLSKARAESVASALASMGVPRAKLVTRGFGPDHPIADNKTAAGKAQNRRVEVSVAQKSGATPVASAAPKASTAVVAPK